MTAVIEKYLRLYSEPETQALNDFTACYEHCLVLPLYREPHQALERFCRFANQQGKTLIIAIINRPDNDDNIEWATKIMNQLAAISDKVSATWCSDDHLALWSIKNHSGLLIVDRCLDGQPIPQKQGVGLARKIGADIACQLIHRGNINSSWIHNSDGDASLPSDYFLATNQLDDLKDSAAYYPFQHVFIDNKIAQLPTQLYEFSLHYYVEALRWAGSCYSYHTIGSIIVINYNHYAQSRGFPKRAGAEDFYLLNKLAKLGSIQKLQSQPIQIEARESDRVPFGTGPAVKKLSSIDDAKNISLYHPNSFEQLRIFHQLLNRLTEQKTLNGALSSIATELDSLSMNIKNCETILTIIDKINLNKALAHAFKQAQSPNHRRAQLNIWFDSFLTLKFIHHSRDISAATINFYQLQELVKQQQNIHQSLGQRLAETTVINSL